MRIAIVTLLLLAACAIPPRGNLHVGAPRELDGAAVLVDGVQASALVGDELRDPIRVVAQKIMGVHQRSAVSATCQVAAGTHTLRFVKRGWEPIERTVEVKEPGTMVLICPADLRPAK